MRNGAASFSSAAVVHIDSLLVAASLLVLMKLLSKVDQGTELGCELSNLVTFLSCCFLAWIISVGAFAEWSAVMLMQMDA